MKCRHCQIRSGGIEQRDLCHRCFDNLEVRALYPSRSDVRYAARPRCLHCSLRVAGQHRGLCMRCYCDKAIRIRYPALPIAGDPANLIGVETARKKLGQPDPNPTHHLPGTEAKVQVLIARAKAGYSLFHPDDAMLESVVDVPLLAMLAG